MPTSRGESKESEQLLPSFAFVTKGNAAETAAAYRQG